MTRLALVPAAVHTLLAAQTATAQSASDRPLWRPVVMGRQAMIAAEHPLEAMAAQKVLEAGGNAIDAAVAAFYMTTVVEHHQAGIGGDAFILMYLADRNEVVFINGTGVARSKAATRERYLALGGIPDAGPFSSSVPGAVAGFDLALRNSYGLGLGLGLRRDFGHGTEYPEDLTGVKLTVIGIEGQTQCLDYAYKCRERYQENATRVLGLVPQVNSVMEMTTDSPSVTGYVREGYAFSPNLTLGMQKTIGVDEELLTCLKVAKAK